MTLLFTDPDTWHGGFYELAIELGPRSDERLKAALETVWRDATVEGCYERGDVEPSLQPRVLPSLARVERGHLRGVATDYAVEWPTELGDGAAAAAVGWKMYEAEEPLKTREYRLLGAYLEIDCKSMARLLGWMRANCTDADKSMLRMTAAQTGLEQRSGNQPLETRRHGNGWYGVSVKWFL